MTRKHLKAVQALFSRRRALRTLGGIVGTATFGCGDSDAGSAGSSGDDTTSSSGTVPTTGDPNTTSSSDVDPSTSSASDSLGSSTDAEPDSSSGDESDSSTGSPVDECGGGSDLTPEQLLAGIDHIVVLMMENRSFDHYFGALRAIEGQAILGLTGDESNLGLDLVPVPVFVMDEFEPKDPPHTWEECHFQFNQGENNGFVFEAEKKHPGYGYQVMGYHIREHLPVSYGLADGFTLCQRWFSSVMGPTWPNRYYLHACTSDGGKTNFPTPFLPSLWHLCDAAGVTSKMYFTDVPWAAGGFPLIPTVWSKLADGYEGFNLAALTNPNTLERFFADCESGNLANFVVIDPGFTSNDDHPEHNIQLGQILIGTIYKALAASPAWSRTLFIVTYDEHGGFYDHVAPPTFTDDHPEFRQLGFRVPTLVVGPTVRRGCINDVLFDHCSIAATVARRFGIEPLNQRMADAADVSSCINPDLLDNPQPAPPIPMVTVSITDILAGVGKTTSQHELFDQLGVVLDEEFRAKVQSDTLRLLVRAEKLGVARLRP